MHVACKPDRVAKAIPFENKGWFRLASVWHSKQHDAAWSGLLSLRFPWHRTLPRSCPKASPRTPATSWKRTSFGWFPQE